MENKLEKKNFIWNFLGLTINAFNSLFFLIIINRINGPKDGGIFTYSFSLVCLLYYIGLYYNRAYQISNKEYSNSDFVASRVLSCLAMLVVSIFLIFIFNYDFNKSLVIILLTLVKFMEALADVFYGMVQADNKLYKAGFSMFIKSFVGIIIFLIIDIITKNMIYSVISILAMNILVFIVYDIQNCKKYFKEKFKTINVREIYICTLPIFIFSFLNLYLVNASKYFLDFYSTSEIQNIYGIILMPGTMISLAGQYILNPYLVKLASLHKENKYIDFNKLVKKIVLYLTIFSIVAVIGAYIVGIPLLSFIYGIELTKYKLDLIIIIVGSLFWALVSVYSSSLTIFNKNLTQMYVYIVCSIISTILCFILIKNYNIMGSSLVYAITMLLQFIIFFIIYNINISKGVNKYEKGK